MHGYRCHPLLLLRVLIMLRDTLRPLIQANGEADDFQQTLRSEADAVLGREGEFTADAVLPSHLAFINETLRFRPVAITSVPHMVTEDNVVVRVCWRSDQNAFSTVRNLTYVFTIVFLRLS